MRFERRQFLLEGYPLAIWLWCRAGEPMDTGPLPLTD